MKFSIEKFHSLLVMLVVYVMTGGVWWLITQEKVPFWIPFLVFATSPWVGKKILEVNRKREVERIQEMFEAPSLNSDERS